MTRAAGTFRRWLSEPAATFSARWLIYLGCLGIAVLGVAVGGLSLLTGAHGDPITGAVLLLYGAANASLLVVIRRGTGRIRHLVLGVLLAAPADLIDAWVVDEPSAGAPSGFAVLLGLGLLINLARYSWRSRPTRTRSPAAE